MRRTSSSTSPSRRPARRYPRGMGFFVDVHSHVVPSGDDGAQRVVEGLGLCREAAAHGTAILYATPHVWPHLHADRRARAGRSARTSQDMADQAELELRLGVRADAGAAAAGAGPEPVHARGHERRPDRGAVHRLGAAADRDLRADGDAGPAAGHRAPRAHAVGARAAVARTGARRARLAAAGERQLADRAPRSAERGAGVGARRRRARRRSWGRTATAARGPATLDDAYAATVTRVGETQARSIFDGSAIGAAATAAVTTARAGASARL